MLSRLRGFVYFSGGGSSPYTFYLSFVLQPNWRGKLFQCRTLEQCSWSQWNWKLEGDGRRVASHIFICIVIGLLLVYWFIQDYSEDGLLFQATNTYNRVSLTLPVPHRRIHNSIALELCTPPDQPEGRTEKEHEKVFEQKYPVKKVSSFLCLP